MNKLPRVKIKRQDLKPGDVLCSHCPAKCCRYFSLPIEKPETFDDFEYLRWYLLHDRASVFIEDDDWYLLVHTVCKHLMPDQRCCIYETRPINCREYATDACEYEDDWTYERYFETPEQIHEYAEAILQCPGQDIRSPQPTLMPVLH